MQLTNMTDHYYKLYPNFERFAILLSQIDFENCDYYESDRNAIYDRLRLPMKVPAGEVQKYIDSLIKDFFNLEDHIFSIIPSTENSQIHSDVNFKKAKELNRYCNFAFPLKGNFDNRLTYWPALSKKDNIKILKTSYINNEVDYKDKDTWRCSVKHKLYQPILLNTELPHGTIGSGYTLFAYITIRGKSYKDCAALYDSISSSATI